MCETPQPCSRLYIATPICLFIRWCVSIVSMTWTGKIGSVIIRIVQVGKTQGTPHQSPHPFHAASMHFFNEVQLTYFF